MVHILHARPAPPITRSAGDHSARCAALDPDVCAAGAWRGSAAVGHQARRRGGPGPPAEFERATPRPAPPLLLEPLAYWWAVGTYARHLAHALSTTTQPE